MRILWVSGRRMGSDLASSTEDSVCSHLSSNGYEVCLISPGKTTISNYLHIPIKDLRFPGITSISGAIGATKIIKEIGISEYDLILIDWRYVSTMRNLIRGFSKPWAIIDRGPPSNPGPLNKFQKWFWKRAWKVADEASIGGLVVSEKHGDFVKALTGFSKDLFVLPAGAEDNKYNIDKEDPRNILKLVYVGMLDRRREVGKIIDLSLEIERRAINHCIFICGKGDSEKEMRKTGLNMKNISFMGNISNDDVQKLLSTCHVGIMPMPDIPIWRISSTLKLAEYLAAGLAIVGPDHPGNRIDEMGKCNLLEKGNWVIKSVDRIASELDEGWIGVSESSIGASKCLSWEKISERLGETLESWSGAILS